MQNVQQHVAGKLNLLLHIVPLIASMQSFSNPSSKSSSLSSSIATSIGESPSTVVAKTDAPLHINSFVMSRLKADEAKCSGVLKEEQGPSITVQAGNKTKLILYYT